MHVWQKCIHMHTFESHYQACISHPLNLLENGASGKFYNFENEDFLYEAPEYRHLLVEHGNEFCLVEQVGKAEVEATVKRWRAADSDVRILKFQRDAAGNRNRPLADSGPLYT